MATVDVTKIHQGPGTLWMKVVRPLTGKRLLIDSTGTPVAVPWAASTAYALGQQVIDSNGNIEQATVAGTSGASAPAWPATLGATVTDGSVTWQAAEIGSNVFAGATSGAATVGMAPKLEEVTADQVAGPVDVIMTAEAATMELTMMQSDLANLQNFIAHGTYAAGTDPGLPSGEQSYEEIAFGGILPVPRVSVAVISPRRNAPSKFVVSQLYQAYQAEAVQIPFQRAKETTYKVKLTGLADPTRPAGDQVGKIYRQT
jgi:hypothetical protein